jgi:hypothetical protein
VYPSRFFDAFPPFPSGSKVFVAMSFDPQFSERWERVIAPAIGGVAVNGDSLLPVRVDAGKASESILTEILDGIGNSLLVFADVTSIGQVGSRSVRNDNVMYEVGLAHAIRQPEEVLLFRSDDDKLLFDLANVRVNRYDPEAHPEEAVQAVRDAIVDAIRAVDQLRNLTVKSRAEALDYACWETLLVASQSGEVADPRLVTYGEVVANSRRCSAISRLLETGALRTKFRLLTPEIVKSADDRLGSDVLRYQLTPLGDAMIRYAGTMMGVASPEVQPLLRSLSEQTGVAGEEPVV